MRLRRTVAVLVGPMLLGACGTPSGANFFGQPTIPTGPSTSLAPPPPVDASTLVPAPPTAPTTIVGAGPAGDGHLTMAFTGDALWHSPLWRQAEHNYATAHPGDAGMDFSPMLANLRPLIESVDLGVCHLETPIAPEGESYTTHPLYGVPPEVVPAIAGAGFDRCSLASNHSADRGVAGIERTVDVVEQNGLGFSGMARTPAEIEPRVFTVDGVTVSHLSYTYGYNGLVLPAGQEWRSALIDPQRIIADAQQARQLGARLVIVSLQWGIEGESSVSAEQRRLAEAITASGAVDLIVGHHTHVLQPIERVNGVWVVYGLGNMISNMPTGPFPPASQDGAVAVVDVTISGGMVRVGQPVVHPTWVDRDHGWVIYVVQPALADPALDPWLRTQLETSLGRTRAVLAGFIPA